MMKKCSNMMSNVNPAGMMEKGMGVMQGCMAIMNGSKTGESSETTPDRAVAAKAEDSSHES